MSGAWAYFGRLPPRGPRGGKRTQIQSRAELVERYGWRPQELARDADAIIEHGCPYCEQHSRNGHYDYCLAIIDPALPPHYWLNTRWCCQSCNPSLSARAKYAAEYWRWLGFNALRHLGIDDR